MVPCQHRRRRRRLRARPAAAGPPGAEPIANRTSTPAARGSADAAGNAAPARRPSLARRMACFVYEAMLLFGHGAAFRACSARSSSPRPASAIRCRARRRCASSRWSLYGVYFVWLWSSPRPDAGDARPGASASSPPRGAQLSPGARAGPLSSPAASPGSRRRPARVGAAHWPPAREPGARRHRDRRLRAARAASRRAPVLARPRCAARASSLPRRRGGCAVA
mgnify:CR=1 FL=1